MSHKFLLTLLLVFCLETLPAQQVKQQQLNELVIRDYKTINGIGRMKDEEDNIIYSGKKTEVLFIDSLEANKAGNNTRQIIGRIPGLNIIETESNGFTANGIGFRGLNPYQSIETNSRQNGYNISADVFGYNEAYYLPPMEAVNRIIFVRGASSLAFGPQIGGMVNYQLRNGSEQPFAYKSSLTVGSYGLFNSFNSIGLHQGKWSAYGFLQYKSMDGWRKNSEQQQVSGFASVTYALSPKVKVGLEYTGLSNKVHMPGGLTDAMFNVDPKQSTRARNWLQSPWNIVSAHVDGQLNKKSSFSINATYLHSRRDLVWRNEDGGPAEADSITPNLTYVPREVEHEYFRNFSTEARFITHYNIGSQQHTLAAGMRYAYSYLKRQHGGEGSTGSDIDYTRFSEWGGDMSFFNSNIAFFAENTFRITRKLNITPGVRYEYLKTVADGYDENSDENPLVPYVFAKMNTKTRNILLGGIGIQYNMADHMNFYGNINQSYKPITYADLTPFGTVAKIDPNLKDAYAINVDAGCRGSYKNVLNADVSVFYLNYMNRTGTIYLADAMHTPFRTNTGNSIHQGIETYVEVNLLNGIIQTNRYGKLSFYNSFALIDARYVSGEYAGNQVEYAPKQIERIGLTYQLKRFNINLQQSYTSKSFADASNATFAEDGLSGTIPAYAILDMSASVKMNKHIQLKAGINNVTNTKYFTLRTTEYPGPGIIPSIGRMMYVGCSMAF